MLQWPSGSPPGDRAAESGFLAALTSATFSVVAGGVACLAALGVVAWRVPTLRDYRLD